MCYFVRVKTCYLNLVIYVMWYTFVHVSVCVCMYVCECDGDADTVCQFSTGYCTLDISIGFPEHARKPFDGTYLVFFFFIHFYYYYYYYNATSSVL